MDILSERVLDMLDKFISESYGVRVDCYEGSMSMLAWRQLINLKDEMKRRERKLNKRGIRSHFDGWEFLP